MLESVYGWKFLDEPLWRWFIFFGAVILIGAAWKVITDYIKG
jgi:hypothetical protein